MAPVSTPTIVPNAIHPDGSLFAIVAPSPDRHRVRIWDVSENAVKQDVAEENIVATCLRWGSMSMNATATSSSKKNKKSGSLMPVLALGCQDGSVHIFSVNHGEVIASFQAVHTRRITDISFMNNASMLVSASEDGIVAVWDVATRSVISHWKADDAAVFALAVSPDQKSITTAGYSVKLWSLASSDAMTFELTKSWNGHATRVLRVLFSYDGSHVLSLAEQDRFVQVWSCASDAKSTAFSVLSLDANAVDMSTSSITKGILVVSEDGSLNLWKSFELNVSDASKSSKKRKQAVRSRDSRIVFKSTDEQDIPIYSARFSLDDSSMMTVRGSALKPVFEQVQYVDKSGSMQSEILLTRDAQLTSLVQPSSTKKAKSGDKKQKYSEKEADIVGPSHFKMPSANVPESDEPVEAMSNEATIEEKLKSLSLPETSTDKKHSKKVPPKVESLTNMLIQALHTSDVRLLEECLEVRDLRTIYCTVQKLPAKYVLPLLKLIVDRIQGRVARSFTLSRWVRAILVNHMAYLVTVPGLPTHLASLYQTLSVRLAMFPNLLRLQGRLDVIDQQVRLRTAANGKKEEDEDAETQPKMEINENEEEVEEWQGSDSESEDVEMDVEDEGWALDVVSNSAEESD